MAYETLSYTAIFQVPSSSILPLNLLCVNSNRFFALLKPSRLPTWGLCNLLPCFLGSSYSRYTHDRWNSHLLPTSLE